jgi:hypothetical protein
MVSLPFLFFLLLAVCVFSFFTFSPLIHPNSSRFLRSTAYLWYDSLDGLSRGLSLHWTRQVDRRSCPRTIWASSPSVCVRTATDVQRTVRWRQTIAGLIVWKVTVTWEVSWSALYVVVWQLSVVTSCRLVYRVDVPVQPTSTHARVAAASDKQ